MNNNSGGGAGAAVAGIFGLLFLAIELGIIVLWFAGWWKIFAKAGKPGWAAIIPIYNMIVLLEIIGKPLWWIILLLIPCVGLVMYIIILVELAKKFGQGVGYAIGMFLLPFIFFPMLGFGSAQYNPNA